MGRGEDAAAHRPSMTSNAAREKMPHGSDKSCVEGCNRQHTACILHSKADNGCLTQWMRNTVDAHPAFASK